MLFGYSFGRTFSRNIGEPLSFLTLTHVCLFASDRHHHQETTRTLRNDRQFMSTKRACGDVALQNRRGHVRGEVTLSCRHNHKQALQSSHANAPEAAQLPKRAGSLPSRTKSGRLGAYGRGTAENKQAHVPVAAQMLRPATTTTPQRTTPRPPPPTSVRITAHQPTTPQPTQPTVHQPTPTPNPTPRTSPPRPTPPHTSRAGATPSSAPRRCARIASSRASSRTACSVRFVGSGCS